MILDVIFLNLGLKRCRQEFFYLLVTDRKAPHQTSWLQLMTTQKVPELIGSVPGSIGVSYQTWGLGYVGPGTGYEGPGGRAKSQNPCTRMKYRKIATDLTTRVTFRQ